EAFGFTPTKYAHIPLIMKMEGSSKRKLSKRKDPEAAVSFYQKHGYHPNAVLEYLTNLANSGFEDWRRANPSKALEDFNFDISKMGKSGALFNIDKLNNIGKEVISKFSAQEKYKYLVEWASKYDPELNKLIEKNEEFVVNVFNVETEANIRKDISGWSEFRAQYGFFFNEIFDAGDLDIQVLKENSLEKDGLEFLNKYKNFENRNEWQEYHTRMALDLGYAPDTKTYKEDPTTYKGHIGNIMTVLRLALTKSTKSPNLFDVARVLGPQETTRRIEQFINMFDKARTNKLS
nr:glutamate--tRNA ligase [Patescibacteria group bacterium]